MIRNLVAAAIVLAHVVATSPALADTPNDVTIATLKLHGETTRFIVDATSDMSCTFFSGGSSTSRATAEIVNSHGVGTTPELRKEAISLLTAAFLAGKRVRLMLRRSDTDGIHCRIISVEVL
jgi:hypothetical protein